MKPRVWRVPLPAGVRTPFQVFVNGVPQELGTDFQISEHELVFERELVQQKLSAKAWFLGFWALAPTSATMRSTSATRSTAGRWLPRRSK